MPRYIVKSTHFHEIVYRDTIEAESEDAALEIFEDRMDMGEIEEEDYGCGVIDPDTEITLKPED